ncbi:MAG: response regulator [Pseudomonadota bacterium]
MSIWLAGYTASVMTYKTNTNNHADQAPAICIALLDDDSEIRQLVCDYLARYGIRCIGVGSAQELQRVLHSESVDLLLLDILLPDADGLKLCREIRESSRLPIILLTALADESDRVLGLEMGADDYLTKPFSARELLARIRAVLRRMSEHVWVHEQRSADLFDFAGWQLSSRRRTLINPAGTLVSLTPGEFDLLLALVQHPGQVLNRDQLLELTKGRHAQPFDRSVDVQLSRLRRKLADEALIKTVRGGGYLFAEDVERVESRR